MKRALTLSALVLAPTLVLASCGDSSDDDHDQHSDQAAASGTTSGTAEHNMGDHDTGDTGDMEDTEGMDMHDHRMDGGDAPAGIQDAADPVYPVGSEVTVTADHMDGMQGAKGTVTGAYSTTAYSVSYTPTDGGAPVHDHRWVVHEELENQGDLGPAPLADGTEVTLAADHMEGMRGAAATIDSSTQETVYMVDITTADGMTMTNHKWVTESELAPGAG